MRNVPWLNLTIVISLCLLRCCRGQVPPPPPIPTPDPASPNSPHPLSIPTSDPASPNSPHPLSIPTPDPASLNSPHPPPIPTPDPASLNSPHPPPIPTPDPASLNSPHPPPIPTPDPASLNSPHPPPIPTSDPASLEIPHPPPIPTPDPASLDIPHPPPIPAPLDSPPPPPIPIPASPDILHPPPIPTPHPASPDSPPVTLNTPDNVTAPRWADAKDAIVMEIIKGCGGNHVCNTIGYNLSDANQNICGPCEPCFCDVACEIFQDCCFDKIIDDKLYQQLINETLPYSESLAECVDVQFRNLYRSSLKTETIQRLVTKCPAKYKVSTVISQCESSGPINQYIQDPVSSIKRLLLNWPVSSQISGVFYKNRACAKCNSDDDSLVHWNIMVDCGDFVTPSNDKNTNDYIEEILTENSHCTVAYTTPQNFQPRKCTFEKAHQIDSCNITGTRSKFDPVLWKTCEVFDQRTVLSTDSSTEYRNIFCLQCQHEESIKDLVLSPCGFIPPPPFFLILSPDALEDLQNAPQRDSCRCYENQVYDVYQKGCRNLTCATGKKLLDGECVSTIVESRGLAYSVSLRFETTLSQGDVAELGERVFPQNETEVKELTESLKRLFLDTVFGPRSKDVKVYSFTLQTEETALKPNTTLSFQMQANVSLGYETVPHEIETHLLSFHGSNNWTLEVKRGVNVGFTSSYTELADNSELIQFERTGVYVVNESISSSDEFKIKYVVLIKYSLPYNPINPGITPSAYLEIKSTLVCPSLIYNTTDDDIKIVARNDSRTGHTSVLIHRPTGVELSYLDFHEHPDGRVTVCAQEIVDKMSKDTHVDDVDAIDIFGLGLVVTSYVCLGLSALALFLTFFTYCIFSPLRTLPGKSTMGLVLTLLLAIILFLIGGFFTDEIAVCQALGVVTHFFLMSSFTWMVICSAHMYSVFSSVMKHHSDEEGHILRFMIYFIISIVIPLVIVTTTIIANYVVGQNSDTDKLRNQDFTDKGGLSVPSNCKSPGTEIGYGMGICYLSNKESLLYAGAIPIILMCTINLVLFIMTVCSLRKMKKQEKLIKKDVQSHLLTYIKLSTLTGINWLPCTIAAFVSSHIVWYIFLVLCGLQGIFVFVSFVLNKRVLQMYRSVSIRQSLASISTTSRGQLRGEAQYRKGDSHSNELKTSTSKLKSHSGSDDGKI